MTDPELAEKAKLVLTSNEIKFNRLVCLKRRSLRGKTSC